MLDLRLFRERAFATPIASGVLNFICTSSIVFLMPLYLILGRGMAPAEAGLILITQPLVMASIMILSGSLSDRIGRALPATLGMLILSLGLFLLSRLDATTPLRWWSPRWCRSAWASACSARRTAAPSWAPSRTRSAGVAAAILSTARTLGNTLGLGLAGAIFATMLARRDRPIGPRGERSEHRIPVASVLGHARGADLGRPASAPNRS